MSSVLLKCWIGLVGIISAGNAITCFVKQDYPRKKIYNSSTSEAPALTARLFGVWTLLSSAIRLTFAVSSSPPFSSVYVLTFFSFCLALLHFLSEVFLYRTSSLSVATISPFIISGLSIGWMTIECIFSIMD